MQKVLRYVARTWPHGGGSLWLERADSPGSQEPECGSILGLTKAANFNRLDVDHPEEIRAVTQRGLGGISVYGKNLVRSAAELLERAYKPKNLSFTTLTLPGSPEATAAVAAEWGKVVNHLLVVLRRELARKGLPDYIIGVTEIQEKRFLREGGMPLHLHLVFVGRRDARCRWQIEPSWMRETWRAILLAACPEVADLSFGASVDMQPVRKSAAGYLGKYMSKGVSSIETIKKENPQLLELVPRAWYCCTRAMKDSALAHCAYGPAHGDAIKSMMDNKHSELFFSWKKNVEILASDGSIVGTFVLYALNERGRVLLGLTGVIPGHFTFPDVC
jgi:hypothetical protein